MVVIWNARRFSGPSAGTTRRLNRPKQAGEPVRTDANGSARWTVFVPQAGSGHQVWRQSAQFGAVSNVVTTMIQ